MMNDMMSIAHVRHIEKEELVRNHQLAQQAMDAAKIERSRFMVAYQMRFLVNRLAPALAPRLGL